MTTRRKTTSKKKKKPRRGLPDPESVVDVLEMVSPTGKPFRILRTNEVDGYEESVGVRRQRRRFGK